MKLSEEKTNLWILVAKNFPKHTIMFGKSTHLFSQQVNDFGTVGGLRRLRKLRGDDALVVGKADRLEKEDQIHFSFDGNHCSYLYSDLNPKMASHSFSIPV